MRRVAVAPLLFLLACGAGRHGLVNDGMGGGGQLQEGCDRDRIGPACGGLGYDDIGIVAGGVAVLTLLLVNKLKR